MTHLVFSFGTLRQANVQHALFGQRVPSTTDAVVGYRIGRVRISDPAVIAASDSAVHPALIETGDAAEIVEGEVLELGDDQLAAVDHYEAMSFRRVDVEMRSGRKALAYAPKPGLVVEA